MPDDPKHPRYKRVAQNPNLWDYVLAAFGQRPGLGGFQQRAREHASKRELENLNQWRTEHKPGWMGEDEDTGYSPESVAEGSTYTTKHMGDMTEDERQKWWEAAVDGDTTALKALTVRPTNWREAWREHDNPPLPDSFR